MSLWLTSQCVPQSIPGAQNTSVEEYELESLKMATQKGEAQDQLHKVSLNETGRKGEWDMFVKIIFCHASQLMTEDLPPESSYGLSIVPAANSP